MKIIPLTQGKVALVDDEDFELVSQYKWSAAAKKQMWYAHRGVKRNGKWTTIDMHRFIMNPKSGGEIDHISTNGLDNRKKNLRVVSKSQNRFNQRKLASCSSIYKGVSWHSFNKKWQATIGINGKQKHLGYFNDQKEAAVTYDRAAIELFGEYARLNFPQLSLLSEQR